MPIGVAESAGGRTAFLVFTTVSTHVNGALLGDACARGGRADYAELPAMACARGGGERARAAARDVGAVLPPASRC